jgi:hypothetical protein
VGFGSCWGASRQDLPDLQDLQDSQDLPVARQVGKEARQELLPLVYLHHPVVKSTTGAGCVPGCISDPESFLSPPWH